MIKEETITDSESASGNSENAPNSSMLSVLKNRHFLLLWIAQIISQTAQQIINFALILQVATITGSSTAVSGVIISFTIPAILFAAIAGVFVERNSKKTMLVLTNLARGVMVLAYVLTDATWGAGAVLTIFYIVTLLFSAVSQFFAPSELAMIPLLVKREQLVSANSLFNLSFTACQLAGFVVLGPLLLATVLNNNYPMLYLILCSLYVACAILTYFLPQDDPNETAAARRQRGEKVGMPQVAVGATELARRGWGDAKEELIEGWAFIRHEPVLMSAILYWSIAITVFMMLGAIGPNFLSKVLGINPDQIYTILVPGGIGLVAGVIIVGRIAKPSNRQSMINWALFMAGAVLLIFAMVEPVTRLIFSFFHRQPPSTLMLVLLGVMTFLLGLLNSFIAVPAQTALQERSPEDIRARVFSVFFTVSNVILIVPVFFSAALADTLGYPQTVALISVAVLSIAGIGLYRGRKSGAEPPPAEGRITATQVESALTAAAPTPRPLSPSPAPGDAERKA